MNQNTLKMFLVAAGVGSLFALVVMGKMDAIEYTDLIVAAIFGGAGHAAGKGTAVASVVVPPSPATTTENPS
jgi:hypothetical protein